MKRSDKAADWAGRMAAKVEAMDEVGIFLVEDSIYV